MEINTYRINGGTTPVVKWLIGINLAVFLLQLIVGDAFTFIFGLSSAGIRNGFVWQFVTYMFLHSVQMPFHIIFNLLVLYTMGPETERGLGTRNFLTVYFASGIIGGIMWIVLGYTHICIGASGAVYGILGAFAASWPNRQLVFLFFPRPVKAWILVSCFAGFEFVLSVLGPSRGVANLVHLVGLAVGVGYTYWVVRKNWSIFRASPRLRVLEGGRSAPNQHSSANVSAAEIDRLLDKIANNGIGSLSRKERDILEAASRQRRR